MSEIVVGLQTSIQQQFTYTRRSRSHKLSLTVTDLCKNVQEGKNSKLKLATFIFRNFLRMKLATKFS